MHRRKWDAKTKATIVIQGLQGKPVAVICNEYQISLSHYYQGRDQFLAHASHAFEVQQHGRQAVRMAQENARLKKLVGGLLPRIRALKAESPFWGYRRIWAYLRYVEQRSVNKKRMLRLMRAHQLLFMPHLPLKAKRTPTSSTPRPTRPNAWWGLEMTKVLVEGFGWVYIVIVLDWYTKKIMGY